MTKDSAKITEWICDMALSDSQTALKSLYQYYFERLLRFATLYIASSVDAEEIVSDTFLAIWEGRKKLVNVNNFEAYIYTITRYKTISYMRTRTRTNNKIGLHELSMDLFISTDTTPEDDLINKERIDQLNKVINALPPKTKIAFKLVREDKMKYKDAAAILDISVKTVEAHIAIAQKN